MDRNLTPHQQHAADVCVRACVCVCVCGVHVCVCACDVVLFAL